MQSYSNIRVYSPTGGLKQLAKEKSIAKVSREVNRGDNKESQSFTAQKIDGRHPQKLDLVHVNRADSKKDGT